MNEPLSSQQPFSIAELHRLLEKYAQDYQRSERLICFYLLQMKRRRGYQELGFANIEDYALELLGFSPSKTRQLLSLGRKLHALPRLTEALAKGVIGWTKASKVAMVATAEDEEEWVEKAVQLSTRQLERQVRDQLQPGGGMVSWWLTAEQSAVMARAMEICRRMCGEEVDPGRCLDLMAGEFLATYEAEMQRGLRDQGDRERTGAEAPELGGREVSESESDEMMCPDGDELPPPLDVPYSKTAHGVVERDQYRCQYPGCSVMCGLHVHHIEFRSRTGRKSRARSNSPENLLTLCFVHHRMVHAGLIGVINPPAGAQSPEGELRGWGPAALIGLRGRAPAELDWKRPELLASATECFNQMVDAASFDPDDFEFPGQDQIDQGEPAAVATL